MGVSSIQVVSYEESEDITEVGSHEEGSASVEVHLHPHLEPLESKMLSGVMPLKHCACSAVRFWSCHLPTCPGSCLHRGRCKACHTWQ